MDADEEYIRKSRLIQYVRERERETHTHRYIDTLRHRQTHAQPHHMMMKIMRS
jgi:putative IMPACT (imprinted ancient) family translation regulator